MGMGGQRHGAAVLPPGRKLCNRFIGGWVGLRWEDNIKTDNIKTDNIKTDLQEILARSVFAFQGGLCCMELVRLSVSVFVCPCGSQNEQPLVSYTQVKG
jgi:hypothetical protein